MTNSFGDTIREALEELERSFQHTRLDGQVEWKTVFGATDRIRKELRLFEGTFVNVLRTFGKSWAQIGDELGLTRQAAWERFHEPVEEARSRILETHSDEGQVLP
jgi:hypothetical protein